MIPKTLMQVAIGASAALLVGCASSPIPISANFPLTVEPKVRSAGHWGLLSNDVVKQTLDSLGKLGVSGNLYVALPANATAFDRAFQNFLITDLVKKWPRRKAVPRQGVGSQLPNPGRAAQQPTPSFCTRTLYDDYRRPVRHLWPGFGDRG